MSASSSQNSTDGFAHFFINCGSLFRLPNPVRATASVIAIIAVILFTLCVPLDHSIRDTPAYATSHFDTKCHELRWQCWTALISQELR